jgi:hypothetical protein
MLRTGKPKQASKAKTETAAADVSERQTGCYRDASVGEGTPVLAAAKGCLFIAVDMIERVGGTLSEHLDA